MKNNDIRKSAINKIKGKYLEIFIMVLAVMGLTHVTVSLLGYIAQVTLNGYYNDLGLRIYDIMNFINYIVPFINNIIMAWFVITISFKLLKHDKNTKVFLPLEKIGDFFKFLGLGIILYLKMIGWGIIGLLPICIIGLSLALTRTRIDSSLLTNLSIVYSIVGTCFVFYKSCSYSFAIHSYIDNGFSSYSKAIKTSIILMKDEKWKFIKFSLTNIFYIGWIPMSYSLLMKILGKSDSPLQIIPTIISKIVSLYAFIIILPFVLILTTEYYLQLKEEKLKEEKIND